MQAIDTIIHTGTIITVNPNFDQLQAHSLIINNGYIIDICLTAKLDSKNYRARTTVDLSDKVIMPGLINAHGHSAMSLFRGMADDCTLMNWLENHIWPAENAFVSDDFVRTGTELAIAEMIKSGTTCFSDMYFFPETAAKTAEQHGMRAQFAFPIFTMPSPWGQHLDDYLDKGEALLKHYQNHERITIALGPHATYTNNDDSLNKTKQLSDKYQTRVQIHLHETVFEVENSQLQMGLRPIEQVAHCGLLNERLQAVHMTTLNDNDITLLKNSGSHVIHCPESNLKLASGFCPIEKLRLEGINIALGTDGAASNNDLDLFGEMRTAAMLAKAVANDATAINAQEAIRMATINGAKALGIDSITGSIEVGKAADFIALDFSSIEQQPIYDICSHIVYTNISAKVSDSYVAGKCLMDSYQLQSIDTKELSQRCHIWQQKIQSTG